MGDVFVGLKEGGVRFSLFNYMKEQLVTPDSHSLELLWNNKEAQLATKDLTNGTTTAFGLSRDSSSSSLVFHNCGIKSHFLELMISFGTKPNPESQAVIPEVFKEMEEWIPHLLNMTPVPDHFLLNRVLREFRIESFEGDIRERITEAFQRVSKCESVEIGAKEEYSQCYAQLFEQGYCYFSWRNQRVSIAEEFAVHLSSHYCQDPNFQKYKQFCQGFQIGLKEDTFLLLLSLHSRHFLFVLEGIQVDQPNLLHNIFCDLITVQTSTLQEY